MHFAKNLNVRVSLYPIRYLRARVLSTISYLIFYFSKGVGFAIKNPERSGVLVPSASV